ncbi:MAG TPA: type II toxin-antitoxin system RelE/ParE family toxin [Desulfuromonadales bacterium]|jgi:plasmid stabilization system protein ParE
MARRKSIEFAESALVDLEALRAWYAEQGVPEVGARFVAEIVARIEQLPDFPESGRIVPEFGLAAVRELIQPPFRIVYRIGADKIWIVRAWRSERLLKMP